MDIGLKPHAIDKHGVIYKRQDVDESCLKMIKTETYFFRGAKNMTIDAEKAIEGQGQRLMHPLKHYHEGVSFCLAE